MMNDFCFNVSRILNRRADASAVITGSRKYPGIRGKILFHGLPDGVIVCAEVFGLPSSNKCSNPVFAFHIHAGESCTGNESDQFFNTDGHYNPQNTPHPCHAGDMPPLFGAKGHAFSAFLTDRFTVPEIIGRTVIIHAMPDDFMTQPSGNAGEKIACGEIIAVDNVRK